MPKFNNFKLHKTKIKFRCFVHLRSASDIYIDILVNTAFRSDNTQDIAQITLPAYLLLN
jgi:hypothetical protein